MADAVTDDLAAGMAALLAARDERSEALLAAYMAADSKTRRNVALLDYRCRRRCQLLLAWQAVGVRLVYLPGYKLSPALADETAKSARKKRTRDGYRRWSGSVVVLDELVDWGAAVGLPVNCDHVRESVPLSHLLADVETARPGYPTRRVLPR